MARLDGYGYDAYLVHALHPLDGVTLVPIYSKWWDDDYEICFNRSTFYGAWGWNHSCWNDLLVVCRAACCVRRVLFDVILPQTDWRGVPKSRKHALAPRGAAAFPECRCV